MRSLITAFLLGFACLLASPVVGQANDLRHSAVAPSSGQPRASGPRPVATRPAHRVSIGPVTLRVATGYQNVYRDTAWTPVRVTLHNRTSSDISGTLEIPQSGAPPNLGPSSTFHGLYQTPVTLPAGGTKLTVVYVPGSGVRDEINARFVQGNRVLARAVSYTMGIDSSALLIGVLSGRADASTWLAPASQQQITTHVVRLTPATLDPVPQALATFDVIVVTDVDTSQLDSTQRSALATYVRNGGSLLLVGGPNWQETLRPLPASLLPIGTLAGTRVLPNLDSLRALGSISRVSGPQSAVVSDFIPAAGGQSHQMVKVEEAGIPLVVRQTVGSGAVEYLAFDPSFGPIPGWSGSDRLLLSLVASAAPTAVARTWAPLGFTSRFQKAFSTSATTSELSNLPKSTLPLLAIFAALTLAYILLLGPANFLVLRLLKRQYLAWVTIPALALSYAGSAYALTSHLKNGSVIVNTVGLVTLDGSSGPQPASFYVGVGVPLPGDYQLTYHAPALVTPVPQLNDLGGDWWHSAPPSGTNPLGMRVQQDSQTDVTLLAMKAWAQRDMAVNTTVHISGRVTADLRVDARGEITGTIHNGTHLNLEHAEVVAGQSVTGVAAMPPGATIQVRVRPGVDMTSQDQPSVWSHLYGASSFATGDPYPFGPGECCNIGSGPPENTLMDRIQNVSGMLFETENLTRLGEVALVAWTEQPLGTLTVSGAVPHRRDLTLVAMPLSVDFPASGPFQLHIGTIGARLVDIGARPPSSSCCNWFSRNTQQLSVGPGGSMTFEFDVPKAGSNVRFDRLGVSVNSDSDSPDLGRIYDWRARRWVRMDLSSGTAQLSQPDRFISSAGRIMVRLQATAASGDITIDEPFRDVQISGSGTVT
jgi:hypothetical protein